jgi:F-type H+-transporting ATPase subunit delta
MGPTIIARNYADTLLALAQRQGGDEAVDAYARAIDEVAELLRLEPRVREFLETPRVSLEAKQRAVRASFAGRVPEHFLRFLLIVVQKRRQALLGRIAVEYHARVDQLRGRTRAEITLSREPSPELRRELVTRLERKFAKTIVPTFRVDPSVIGGVIVRVGDQVLDGSVRRRLTLMRRRLLEARLPDTGVAHSTSG